MSAKPVVLVVVVQEGVVAEELRAEAVRLHAETPRAAEHCLNVGARHLRAPHLGHPEKVVHRNDTLLP